ncbi:GntR family transcriptional regulator [Tunturiibacter empetritectus]|uniref:DNA-binding MarR family transcriptional regulator n=2 Tax=Tunturiibacter TaxID=3154218 RepID=A0A852VGJ3_9BACT|nr:MarR family transcriptional regulator [Edaphobacter lichenicola]NYF90331.1 DNA-binding MarR family transcriptional regulator [Edaphobacter lichenicola]
MSILPRKEIPDDILKDSVLAHLAAAYFSVGKRLERKTQCSATRGFILSALRGGTTLNQNQIATLLGFDRTVVHRAVKSLAQEGLVLEHRAKTGRAIRVQLTAKGRKYRERLIEAREIAEESVRRQMTSEERKTLLRLLKLVAECDF